MLSGNDTINSIIKNFAFNRNNKDTKEKIQNQKWIFVKPWIYRNHIKNYKWVCVNEAFKTLSFPNSLKCANVRPIYKKGDPFDKKNYRPVNILTLLLKVYERVIYDSASNYF